MKPGLVPGFFMGAVQRHAPCRHGRRTLVKRWAALTRSAGPPASADLLATRCRPVDRLCGDAGHEGARHQGRTLVCASIKANIREAEALAGQVRGGASALR